MGNQLSNALKALGDGLSTIALYRAGKEEKADERAYQEQMLEGQRAFQERLLELQQAQGEKMFGLERDFKVAEREDKQLFDMEMFNKTSAVQERQHAEEMAARWAGIRAQAAATASSNNNAAADRQLARQLGVYEKQVEMAASEYSGIQKQMNEEVKALGDDKMLALRPEQLQAARAEIMERYQPQLEDAKAKIEAGMKTYSNAVGIAPQADFGGVKAKSDSSASPAPAAPEGAMSGGMAATGSAINDDRVSQAVDAAQRQLGAQLKLGTIPREADLVAGFEKAGLTRAEAVKAARQLQRQAQTDGFTAMGR